MIYITYIMHVNAIGDPLGFFRIFNPLFRIFKWFQHFTKICVTCVTFQRFWVLRDTLLPNWMKYYSTWVYCNLVSVDLTSWFQFLGLIIEVAPHYTHWRNVDKEMTSLLYSRSNFGDIHLVSAQTIIKNKVSLMSLSFPNRISWYLLESVTAIDSDVQGFANP